MKIKLPIINQQLDESSSLTVTEGTIDLDIDTSIYSEERWEQHFPAHAQREGLFEYIERISSQKATSNRVTVASMLKALYCFIESEALPSYKDFAQLFIISQPEYTEKLINSLKSAFKAIVGNSAVKN